MRNNTIIDMSEKGLTAFTVNTNEREHKVGYKLRICITDTFLVPPGIASRLTGYQEG